MLHIWISTVNVACWFDDACSDQYTAFHEGSHSTNHASECETFSL